MPSPFPGFDPYLENPSVCSGLSSAMACEIAAALNQDLPDGFAADVGVHYVEAADEEGPHFSSVEVLALARVAETVTSIIVLKPEHKTPGSWRRAYTRHQQRCVEEGTNLLEIDLLREGLPTVLSPPDALLRQQDHWDYLFSLWRSAERRRCEFWMVSLRSRLPGVRVPLAEGHPDVILDIQACFERAYDAGPYRRRVDYRRDPVPPLSDVDSEWADAVLRGKGLR